MFRTTTLSLLPLLVSALVLGGTAVGFADETSDASKTFGDALTVEKATPIAELLEAPEKWDGKAVRVEGEVEDVCPRRGCWMTLTADGKTVRIKVEDGVVVFPKEAKGHEAVAEGVVRVREMDRESWISWQSHLAEERGETFAADEVGEGPFQFVQIEGRGAEIRGL